jgi:hypothetical protein
MTCVSIATLFQLLSLPSILIAALSIGETGVLLADSSRVPACKAHVIYKFVKNVFGLKFPLKATVVYLLVITIFLPT